MGRKRSRLCQVEGEVRRHPDAPTGPMGEPYLVRVHILRLHDPIFILLCLGLYALRIITSLE